MILKPYFMSEYREGFVRLLYGIILAQFVVITLLLGGFTSEYASNAYFQIWVQKNFPQLGILLTGQFDALTIGMALGGTFLLIQRMKNGRRKDQSTGVALSEPSSMEDAGDPIPNHVTMTRKMGIANETPEQILGELEKNDS